MTKSAQQLQRWRAIPSPADRRIRLLANGECHLAPRATMRLTLTPVADDDRPDDEQPSS